MALDWHQTATSAVWRAVGLSDYCTVTAVCRVFMQKIWTEAEIESGASAPSAPGLGLVHLEHLLLVCLPNTKGKNLGANHWQMWLNKKWYSNCLCHYCIICTSIISSKDQVTEVCSNAGYHSTFGALLWQFSSSSIQLSSPWKFSSSKVYLIFLVIDSSDLRANVAMLDHP